MKRVFAFVGFSTAVTLILLNVIAFSYVKFILLTTAVLLSVSLSVKKLRQEKVLPITFCSILFACLVFVFCVQVNVAPQKSLDGKTAYARFQIVDIETKSNGVYLYTVKTSSIDLPNAPQNIKLKIKSKAKIYSDYYDNISGLLSFYSYAKNGFDSFGDYGDGIYVRAGLINYDVASNDNKPFNYHLIKLRLKIREIIENNLDGEKAGLALSIFTGDKRSLSDNVAKSFKVCGISHMTAVSGLHISLICLLIYIFLKFLKIPDFLRTFITLFILFIYSGIADYSKSVIRAGIMITVMLLAKLFNNKADALNSLGLAVFIICLNPFAVTDVSAVLTSSAVMGLTVIKPAFDEYIKPENRVIKYFYNGMFAGVSVLIATLPALWLFFGKVSLLSLIINIIAVPVMQIALISVFLLIPLSYIPVLVFIPKYTASFSLGALIKIADFSREHFEFLYLNISDSIFGLSISGILLLTGVSVLIFSKADIRIISFFIAVMLSVSTVLSIYDYNRNAYVTVSDNGAVFIYDKESIVVIDANDNGDCYALEEIADSKSFNTALIFNSYNKESRITDILPYAEFISDNKISMSAGGNITIKYNSGIITAAVSDKVFKIDDDYVKINGYKYFRNIYDKFSEKGDFTFIVTPNSELQIKDG